MVKLVSILIPAYKAETLIGQTLSCALAQTWPRKEIIVVDDGSPDSTYEVARRYEGPQLKVVTQRNEGAPGARNHALRLAQGDYIQWLDSDDLLHPRKIEHQMAHACNGDGARTLLTASWGKFFFRSSSARFIPDALWEPRLSPMEWFLARFNKGVWMNPTAWLVSHQLAEAAGPWDGRLARSGDDDGEYLCRVVAASDGVHFVPEAKCYYRIGTVGSLNWNMETSEQHLDSLLLSMQLCIGHLRNLEASERTRRASLCYLHIMSRYFYGTPKRFLDALDAMARGLTGNLEAPGPGWKYYPIEKAFGPQVTKTVIRNWRASKLLARRNVDLCLYRMGI